MKKGVTPREGVKALGLPEFICTMLSDAQVIFGVVLCRARSWT